MPGVLPQDQAAIVRRLQTDARVGIVGDGINDAPSIRSADRPHPGQRVVPPPVKRSGATMPVVPVHFHDAEIRPFDVGRPTPGRGIGLVNDESTTVRWLAPEEP
jgi:hypothetical protein